MKNMIYFKNMICVKLYTVCFAIIFSWANFFNLKKLFYYTFIFSNKIIARGNLTTGKKKKENFIREP